MLVAIAVSGGPAFAQGMPVIEMDVMTDLRERGLSWSDGEAAARVFVEVPVSSALSVSAQGATLRGSDRHGGADAGFDLAATYSDYAGLIDWRAGAVWHLFAGGTGELDYAEVEAGVGASLGPAQVDLLASYAPSQDAIGGSNFYTRAGAYLGIPATPWVVRGHVGHSTGSSDGSGRNTRLRPAASYTDWAIGTEYYLAPFSLSLTYSDTDVSRGELRQPVLDDHYGQKLVAGAMIRF